MEGVLDGLKVVSLEHMEAVPAASVWLADWGAEVIKVEPLHGEKWRAGLPASDNWAFQLLNRNKRSLAIDLKTSSGKQVLEKLVMQADVFVSNYHHSVLESLGADYESAKKLNPDLVYAFLTAYGTRGPEKDTRGVDLTAAWARSGFQYLMGEPEGVPVRQRGGAMDRTAASHLAAGICAAYIHKLKTGEGQLVEVSLYQSAVWTMALDIENTLAGRVPIKRSRTNPVSPLNNSYRSGDGRWFQLAMSPDDETWQKMCGALGKPEWVTDPMYVDYESRMSNKIHIVAHLDRLFITKNVDEWGRIFRKQGFMFSVIASPDEVVEDLQAIANGFFNDISHPEGTIRVVSSPVRFVQNPAVIGKPAPEAGEDNTGILRELGFGDDAIAEMRNNGTIL